MGKCDVGGSVRPRGGVEALHFFLHCLEVAVVALAHAAKLANSYVVACEPAIYALAVVYMATKQVPHGVSCEKVLKTDGAGAVNAIAR